MQPPPTCYAEREGVSIAYQVVGDAPIDLLLSPGFITHLDLVWTDPRYAKFLARLASFSRLILYDKPGTGLSDPRRTSRPSRSAPPTSSPFSTLRDRNARCCWATLKVVRHR